MSAKIVGMLKLYQKFPSKSCSFFGFIYSQGVIIIITIIVTISGSNEKKKLIVITIITVIVASTIITSLRVSALRVCAEMVVPVVDPVPKIDRVACDEVHTGFGV